ASAAQSSHKTHRVHLNAKAKVNSAFNSFTRDYMHAFDTYLDALNTTGSNATTAQATFEKYITERGNLLAPQLVPIIAHVPGSLGKLLPSQRSEVGNTASTPLESFLVRRITGGSAPVFNAALVPSLKSLIPSTPVTKPEANLYRLSATNAIEAARKNTF